MIGIMISFSGLILLVVYIFLFHRFKKTKENIYADVKIGLICYSCKKDIIGRDNEEYINHITEVYDNFDGDHIRVCKVCDRDNKLSDLTKFNIISKRNILRIKKLLFNTSYFKFLLLPLFILIILGHAIDFYLSPDIHLNLGNYGNIILWSFNIFQLNSTYRNKKSS